MQNFRRASPPLSYAESPPPPGGTYTLKNSKVDIESLGLIQVRKLVGIGVEEGERGGGGGGLITRGTGHDSLRIPPGIVYTIVSKSGNFKS